MRRRTEPASALLIAVLIASLLASAAAIVMIETRAARASTGESLRIEVARLRARALIAETIVRLDKAGPTPAQGLLVEDRDGARVLRQDAAGLIDINAAQPDKIAALLVQAGFTPESAATFADRIADWRDEDDLVHLHGAEKREYEAAGYAPPANRPFTLETEIASVLGATPALAQCLAPFLTTYSGASEPNAMAAPTPIRQALGLPEPTIVASEAPPFGHVIILTAEAPISAHAVLRVRSWVRLTGDQGRPFITHRAFEELAPRGGGEVGLSCPPPAELASARA